MKEILNKHLFDLFPFRKENQKKFSDLGVVTLKDYVRGRESGKIFYLSNMLLKRFKDIKVYESRFEKRTIKEIDKYLSNNEILLDFTKSEDFSLERRITDFFILRNQTADLFAEREIYTFKDYIEARKIGSIYPVNRVVEDPEALNRILIYGIEDILDRNNIERSYLTCLSSRLLDLPYEFKNIPAMFMKIGIVTVEDFIRALDDEEKLVDVKNIGLSITSIKKVMNYLINKGFTEEVLNENCYSWKDNFFSINNVSYSRDKEKLILKKSENILLCEISSYTDVDDEELAYLKRRKIITFSDCLKARRKGTFNKKTVSLGLLRKIENVLKKHNLSYDYSSSARKRNKFSLDAKITDYLVLRTNANRLAENEVSTFREYIRARQRGVIYPKSHAMKDCNAFPSTFIYDVEGVLDKNNISRDYLTLFSSRLVNLPIEFKTIFSRLMKIGIVSVGDFIKALDSENKLVEIKNTGLSVKSVNKLITYLKNGNFSEEVLRKEGSSWNNLFFEKHKIFYAKEKDKIILRKSEDILPCRIDSFVDLDEKEAAYLKNKGVTIFADYIEARRNGKLYIKNDNIENCSGANIGLVAKIENVFKRHNFKFCYIYYLSSRLSDLPRKYRNIFRALSRFGVFTVADFVGLKGGKGEDIIQSLNMTTDFLNTLNYYLLSAGFSEEVLNKQGLSWHDNILFADAFKVAEKEEKAKAERKKAEREKFLIEKAKKENLLLSYLKLFDNSETALIKIFNPNVTGTLYDEGIRTVKDLSSITEYKFSSITRDRFALNLAKKYGVKFKQ